MSPVDLVEAWIVRTLLFFHDRLQDKVLHFSICLDENRVSGKSECNQNEVRAELHELVEFIERRRDHRSFMAFPKNAAGDDFTFLLGIEEDDAEKAKDIITEAVPSVEGWEDVITDPAISIEDFVNMDEDVAVCGEITDEEIIAEVLNNKQDGDMALGDEDGESSVRAEINVPSAAEAAHHIMEFRHGRQNVEDDSWPGHPSTSKTEDNVEKVANLIRRISALEKKTENPDDRVHNAEVTKSPVKVKHNNKAVNNNSPDNETDQSYVTRSKQINGIKEKQLKFSSCVSKSCINRREIDSKKGKDSTEIENITVTTVAKRRTLFNPNCVYLSDATSEASEVVVENTLRNNKDPSDEVQPSFGDLLQLVKNKYCSPRKTSYQNSPKTSPSIEQTNVKINDKGESLKKNLQTPIVKLVKLTEEECRSATSGSQLNLEDGVERRNARSRKRTLKEEENLEDASTIVNMALQNSIPKIAEQSNKRVR
ncbi:hypothetical protein J6590_019063 [Homalodisca vitripennis]|nr:hypothetical protein J6590_019063 [Homalodisca vitripennis]